MNKKWLVNVFFRKQHNIEYISLVSQQFNSILYSDCQIHFSASTKQSIQIHKYTNLTYFIVSTG